MLADELEAILPGSATGFTYEPEAAGATDPDLGSHPPRPLVPLPQGGVRAQLRVEAEVFSIVCHPLQCPREMELQLASTLVRLYNSDFRVVKDLRRDWEVWTALSRSRFARCLARFSAFSTTPFVQWLDTIEAARTQTYETQAFTANVIFTKQLRWVESSPGQTLVSFSSPIPFPQALLAEKWIRPLLADEGLALVALGHRGSVVGVTTCDGESVNSRDYAPHERLRGLHGLVVPGTAAVSVSRHGDLYVALPNGSTFGKSQGQWHYHDYAGVEELLARHLCREVARNALQMSLNLSFDRTGALFVFLEDAGSITELVPDHGTPERVARPLRQSVLGLKLAARADRRFLTSAARADGAVMLTSSGEVLDAACMISEPSRQRLDAVSVSNLKKFAGARTTAAWNGSFFGVAIKVSEDGPIEIYLKGELQARLA